MNLIIGQLFDVVRLETNTTRTFRVIGLLGPDASWVWIIDIRSRKARPCQFSKEQALTAIKCGNWIPVSGDNFPSSHLSESDLTEAQKQAVESTWVSLKPLLNHCEELYFEKRRWKIIQEIAAQHEISARQLLRNLRRFWQRGMTRLSIMPDYRKCGQTSVCRDEQGRKRGVKSRLGEGFRMTDADVARCISAYKHQFLKNQKASLRSSYFWMLNEFYAASRINNCNDITIVSKPRDERPSFAQFRWVVEKQNDYTARIQARFGQKVFNKDFRPLRGRASDITFGPGHIYQIDATPWDITLVSRVERVPIGKPTLYLVIDAFSHAVAGFHLCLEHASYDAAAAALYCAFSDKTQFAELHGVSLSKDDWPIQGLPQTIYADRGELIGLAVENACGDLRIQIANTPPFRADMKPNVEAAFKAFNGFFLSTLPGYNPGYKRLENPAKEAVFDIGQMIQLLIKAIIAYNRRILKNYPIRIEEFGSSVPHIPHELWTWGIQNRGGSLRFCGDELLVPAMLRRENAQVTGRGIKFRGLYFSCDAQWMIDLQVRARVTKSIPIEVAYHVDCVNRIYLKPTLPGLPYIECELANESAVFRNWTFDEVKNARNGQALTNAEGDDEYTQRRAQLEDAKSRAIAAGKVAASQSPERLKVRDRASVKAAEAGAERPKNALTGSLPTLPSPKPVIFISESIPPKSDLSVFDALVMTTE